MALRSSCGPKLPSTREYPSSLCLAWELLAFVANRHDGAWPGRTLSRKYRGVGIVLWAIQASGKATITGWLHQSDNGVREHCWQKLCHRRSRRQCGRARPKQSCSGVPTIWVPLYLVAVDRPSPRARQSTGENSPYIFISPPLALSRWGEGERIRRAACAWALGLGFRSFLPPHPALSPVGERETRLQRAAGAWALGLGLRRVPPPPLPGPLPGGERENGFEGPLMARGRWDLAFVGLRPHSPGPLPGGERETDFECCWRGRWDLAFALLGPLTRPRPTQKPVQFRRFGLVHQWIRFALGQDVLAQTMEWEYRMDAST